MRKLSGLRGCGGSIKGAAEDFVVEEIQRGGVVLEAGRRYVHSDLGMEAADSGKFSVFVLQKRDWNTMQALRAVAKKCGRGFKSVGFAGTKDKTSVSTQLCSIFGAKPDALASLRIKDISINGSWASDAGVKLGDLVGNRFTIRITAPYDASAIQGINDDLCGVFPNYFGEQRFGVRGNNVKIGVSILQGDFEGAVMEFLTGTENEKNAGVVEARNRLRCERDFASALGYFPAYLKYERLVLDRLSQYPTDYANSLRRLPRQLLLMFVHSVEAHIFNMELEARVTAGETSPRDGDLACLADTSGFPDMNSVADQHKTEGKKRFAVGSIVGFESERLTQYQDALLNELGISKEQFKIKTMPELSMKGTYRALFAPYIGFSSSIETGNAVLKFSLPAGAYATALLNEFMN